MALMKIFSALGDPTRFKIYRILLRQKDTCVSEIADILGISVPAASQQLKMLENVGLLIRKRKGQSICYEITIENTLTKEISKLIKKVEN